MVKYTDLTPDANKTLAASMLLLFIITLIALIANYKKICYAAGATFITLIITSIAASAFYFTTTDVPKDAITFGHGIDEVDGGGSMTGYIEKKDLNNYLKDKYNLIKISDNSYKNIKTNKKYDDCTINYGNIIKSNNESFIKIKGVKCSSTDMF